MIGIEKVDINQRYTPNDMVCAVRPSKLAEQRELDKKKEEFLRRGGRISVLHVPAYDLIRPLRKGVVIDEDAATMSQIEAATWLGISAHAMRIIDRSGCGPARGKNCLNGYRYSITALREWELANAKNPFPSAPAAECAGMMNMTAVIAYLGGDPRDELSRQTFIALVDSGVGPRCGMSWVSKGGKTIRYFWKADVDAYRPARGAR